MRPLLLAAACILAACADRSGTPQAASAAAAPGALVPVETLDLPRAVWGAEVGNSVKAMAIAYDSARDLLWSAGTGSGVVVVASPGVGRPVASVDLGDPVAQVKDLVFDAPRDRVIWFSRTTGALRSIDAASREVKARWDPPAHAGRGGKSYQTLVVDPASGWSWVLNPRGPDLTGFSPDFQQVLQVGAFAAPLQIAADPRGDLLWILDNVDDGAGANLVSYRPSTGAAALVQTLTRPGGVGVEGRPAKGARSGRAPRGAEKPRLGRSGGEVASGSLPVPGLIHVAADGTVILAGKRTFGLAPDGRVLWSATLPGEVARAANVGTHVAFTLQEAGFAQGHPESLVVVLDVGTGREEARLKVGLEARKVASDPARNRLFVANGGAGSVSVVDLGGLQVTGEISVALAAEGLVVDPRTGTRYVLDRLGGSRIHVWKPGAARVTDWPVGRWPTELALDGDRRLLIALGHYDAALYAWNLDDARTLPALSLGVPGNTGDTLGDLAYDPATGTAAVVFPETGWMSVVDVPSGKVLWTREVAGLAAGPEAGPGIAHVGVDGRLGRVWLHERRARRIVAYDLATGAVVSEATLPPSGARKERSYHLNTLHVDRAGGRLFAGDTVIDASSLAVRGSVAGIDKVFWVDGDRLLGLSLDDQGAETLVLADPRTLATRLAWPLQPLLGMGREATWDPASSTLYVCALPTAQVTAWRLPDP